MSESSKPLTSPIPPARGKLYRVALVGAGSLRGKEVADVLNERNFPAADIRPVSYTHLTLPTTERV